jgi:hypothetical protein
MRLGMMMSALLIVTSTGAWAQTGTTYRFRADTLVGTMWVSGDNARRELESGEGGTAAGRVEIWKDGGKQVFILNPKDHTYYEDNAFRARQGLQQRVSVAALTVQRPFTVVGVDKVQVDLQGLPKTDVVSGYPCRRALLTFSYMLATTVEGSTASIPGRVEGTEELCLMDGPEGVRLPFDHRLELRSGHPQVDAAVAERLATLKGIPVARLLKVTRQIEGGEVVSGGSALLLSDIRDATIAADRFEVPKSYTFREPQVAAPARK